MDISSISWSGQTDNPPFIRRPLLNAVNAASGAACDFTNVKFKRDDMTI
jgi:hypothetical protein